MPSSAIWCLANPCDPTAFIFAAMALGRSAAAIGVRGRVYSLAAIDAQLMVRHEEKKVRRQGGRTQGPSAFTAEDRERFKANLSRLIRESLDSCSQT